MYAYACRVKAENFDAIRSEDPKYDQGQLDIWMKANIGYFLRDETSPYDCCYIPADEFFKLYAFDEPLSNQLFRKVRKL